MTKGEGGASIWCDGSNDSLTDPVHTFLNLQQASQIAPNEQNDFSISMRYREGETADSSACSGMTKGKVALSLDLMVLATIP